MIPSSIQFRGLTVEFATGNIMMRDEDVIAISCDPQFSMNSSLASACVQSGGQQFSDSMRNNVRNVIPVTQPIAVAIPASGLLRCQYVLLVPLRRMFSSCMKQVFARIISTAIQLGVSSLTFPVIGTGGFRMGFTDCSLAIKEALESTPNFQTLTKLIIVENQNLNFVHSVLSQLCSSVNFDDDQQAGSSNLNSHSTNNTAGVSLLEKTPFSIFYNIISHDELCELREKHVKEIAEKNCTYSNCDDCLDPCPVCLSDMLSLDVNTTNEYYVVIRLTRCQHMFHRFCLIQCFLNKPRCPMCNTWYMTNVGAQPFDGIMNVEEISRGRLEGIPVRGYLKITYSFPNGIQTSEHLRPGVPYAGMKRVCYMPNTAEGHEIVDLLKIAFDRRLLFTVGDSLTTSQRNVLVWNGVHQKTSRSGGPTNHGYPDANFLDRLRQELAAIGITPALLYTDD